MKSLRIQFILGLIAATVIAAAEQVVHPHGMTEADNQSFGARMEKPDRGGSPALVATTGFLLYGLWPPADGSRMYVALENKDAVAVLATDERREVACTRAGQAPRAIVYLPGAVGSEENREPREPRWFFSLQRKATGRVGGS